MASRSTADQIGRLVGDRYRIVESTGDGTASFVAEDTVDGGRVLIEMFEAAPDQAAQDAFAERVQAVASLSHPNLLPVLDWGVDERPWVVSEAMPGGSLAEMIGRGGRLSPSQALVISLEASRALEYVHAAGLVHGRLSPAHLHFGADRRVRLGGTGLLPDTAQTITVSGDESIDPVALVRYQAPEQARGRAPDSANDVYALALVANEAISGKRPPTSPTLVATMLNRAQQPAVIDDRCGVLASLLHSCGAVEPSERPTAGSCSESLVALAGQLERPEPVPIRGDYIEPIIEPIIEEQPDAIEDRDSGIGDFAESVPEQVGLDAGADTEAGHTGDARSSASDVDLVDREMLDPGEQLTVSADDFEESTGFDAPVTTSHVPSETIVGKPNDDLEPVRSQHGQSTLDEPMLVDRSRAHVLVDSDDEFADRPRWPLAILALITLAAGAVAALLWVSSGGLGRSEVPDLVGLQIDEAADRVESGGWNLERREARREGSSPGEILAQDPEPGSELDADSPIALTVSLGGEMVEIPGDLAGLTAEQAQDRLNIVGLNVGQVSQVNSETLPAGLVVSIDEPTTQKAVGETVALRVSLGPVARVVPDGLIGRPIGEVTADLVGLRIGVVEEQVYDPVAPIGVVTAITPASGTPVQADTTITAQVSQGPEPVEIPDVDGLTLGESRELLEALGLVFIDSEGTPGEPAIGTVPAAGEIVDVGTEFVVVLGEPSDDDESDAGTEEDPTEDG